MIGLVASIVIGSFAALVLWTSGSRRERASAGNPITGLAARALAAGDSDQAIRILTNYVAANSNDIDAYISLGILFLKKGWYHRAIDMYRRILARTGLTDAQQKSIMIEIAKNFSQAGLHDRAIVAAEQVAAFSLNEIDDHIFLARLYEAAMEWDLAVSFWQRVKSVRGARTAIGYIRAIQGQECERQDRAKEAMKFYRTALKFDHVNPAALIYMGLLLSKNHKTRQAFSCIDSLIKFNPNFLWEALDLALQQTVENPSREDTFYHQLIDRYKHKAHAVLHHCQNLAAKGQLDAARQILEGIDIKSLQGPMIIRFIKVWFTLSSGVEMHQDIIPYANDIVQRYSYVCSHCGEMFPTLDWKCPKCLEWGGLQSGSFPREDGNGGD
jgi:lipopolysaccharide assembly protein B